MPKVKFATAADAENAFYLAIESVDLPAMMEVWADDDTVVCIHPGAPRIEGAALIRESWQDIFQCGPAMAFSLHKDRVFEDGYTAVHMVREEIAIDGEFVSVMLSTNIYKKTDLGWRMMLHHSSPEPDLFPEELELQDEVPLMLH